MNEINDLFDVVEDAVASGLLVFVGVVVGIATGVAAYHWIF